MENTCGRVDRRIDLELALAKIDDRDRRIIILYYIDGYTQAEIGEMLGVSQQAVAKRTAKILEQLSKQL